MANLNTRIPDEDLEVVGEPPPTQRPAQPEAVWTPEDINQAVERNVERVRQGGGNPLRELHTWAVRLGFADADKLPGDTGGRYSDWEEPFNVERGQGRFDAVLASAPGYLGTPYGAEWDEWLMSLPFVLADNEYNEALARERAAAIQRARSRGGSNAGAYFAAGQNRAEGVEEEPSRPGRGVGVVSPDVGPEMQPDAARTAETINATRAKTIIIIGADGKPKRVLSPGAGTWGKDKSFPEGSDEARRADLERRNWLTDEADKGDSDRWNANDAVRSGELIYVGGSTDAKLSTEGYFGKGRVARGVYMTKADFHTLMRESPELVAMAQATHGINPTGFITDSKTRTLMKSIAEDASSYAQAGQRVDLMFFLTNGAGGGDDGSSSGGSGYRRYGGGGGGGGYGGGGGGGAVPLGMAKRYLNQYMLQYAGREANETEVSTFAAAISGAIGGADFDVQQFTIDWVRMAAGKEVGPYQVATDYYQAMMSALGGLPGAA
jgi:hypothetical protein